MKNKYSFTLTFPNAYNIVLVSQRKMSKTQQWKSSKQTQKKFNSQRGQAQHKNVKTTHWSMQKNMYHVVNKHVNSACYVGWEICINYIK